MKYFNYATGLTMTNNKFSNIRFINSISYGYSFINKAVTEEIIKNNKKYFNKI